MRTPCCASTSRRSSPSRAERLLLLGTRGPFTRAALDAFLAEGVEIAGLVLPESVPGGPAARRLPARRPLLDPGDAPAAADAAGIPCWEVAPPGNAPPPRELPGADRLCTACFPWRLPRSWLVASPGGVNIHPSLLPEWRGPAPLFWQLRAEAPTGVSVHRLEERLDAGPIVAQEAVRLPDGIRTGPAEARLAAAGARLLARGLRSGRLEERPQDESRATRQGWPRPADRRIPATWRAHRAFNFIRGAERWGPFTVEGGGGILEVREALGHQEGRPEPRPGETSVRFADGWLRVAAS